MAGIVASTLRRRTFRQKLAVDAYKTIDAGHISLSPTGSHPPSRSSSFIKGSSQSPPGHAQAPKGAKLFHQDFWPTCINPLEQNLRHLEFETFDTLVPKANSWLQKNLDIQLVKCETIERKVTSLEEVESDNPMFVPKGNHAIYVKGLSGYDSESGSMIITFPHNVAFTSPMSTKHVAKQSTCSPTLNA
ncbi:hypothetical protein LSH36_854g00067 [Paralvinella palmiformis]|uniref:Uncharacterized protein n=1 Tax=Paralvinella palmiformis TaxID=53620 RepID=A0AAD9MTJ4_9ANNE|nr:hypothetical protein LSH36_854g00067 [Paralvinella palmiformis]